MNILTKYTHGALALSFLFYGLCLAKEKAFSCCKAGLTITDALIRDADATFPNINNDGSRVYFSYAKEPATQGQLEAELFANNNGTLQSLNTVTYDAAFLNEGLGLAAPDFQTLFLLDSDDATTIRLRKFDSALNFTGQFTTFNDYGGDESLEAAISADGKFIAISYELTGPSGTTFIRIVDAQTLLTVATTPVPLPGVSNGPRWFTIKSKGVCTKYFAIVTSDLSSFSTLNVFKFDGTLSLVATAALPSFANIPAITLGNHGEALIATGGRQSFNSPTSPSVFPASLVAARQTFIPGDTDILRLYTFVPDALTLVYSESLPAEATRAILFHPNNKCLLVSQIAPGVSGVTGAIASFRCVQACKKDKSGHIVKADASISSSASIIAVPAFDTFNGFSISTNGQWFATGGASNTGVCGEDNPGFRNVNLYQIGKVCSPC